MNSFVFSLIVTFVIVRGWAYFGYRLNDYFDNEDNPHTITGWLRIKTGFNWHSIHFAAIIFFIASLLIYSKGFTAINNLILGISSSMVLDQIFPLIGNWNYFSKKMFIIAILLHLIVALVSIRILTFLN